MRLDWWLNKRDGSEPKWSCRAAVVLQWKKPAGSTVHRVAFRAAADGKRVVRVVLPQEEEKRGFPAA